MIIIVVSIDVDSVTKAERDEIARRAEMQATVLGSQRQNLIVVMLLLCRARTLDSNERTLKEDGASSTQKENGIAHAGYNTGGASKRVCCLAIADSYNRADVRIGLGWGSEEDRLHSGLGEGAERKKRYKIDWAEHC